MKKPKAVPIIGITVFGILLIPFSILSYVLYFAWDSQFEGNIYKIAFEKDGKLYELAIQSSTVAFDKDTNDARLYLNSAYYVSDLVALSYDDYEIGKTDNPFFAGKIEMRNKQKYHEMEQKYLN